MRLLITCLLFAAHSALAGVWAYRQGEALPDGCGGFYAAETAYNYSGDIYGDATVLVQSRDRIDVSRKKILAGQLVDMTEAESAIMDGIEAQAAADAEAARQAAKPDALKTAENNFFALCAALGLEGKPGFATIQTTLDEMQDQQAAMLIALRLLAIDAEAKREGGLQWWNDAEVHP